MIITKCYGKEEQWEVRADAVKEFQVAAMSTEGAEQERYVNILAQLVSGSNYCSDENC